MPNASRSRSRSASPSTIWLNDTASSPSSSPVVTGTATSYRPRAIASVARCRSAIGRRIDFANSTVSSSEIVVATATAISTSAPRAAPPPPDEVRAATTRPVIRLMSGSAVIIRTRRGIAEIGAVSRGVVSLLWMSIRTGRIPASRIR